MDDSPARNFFLQASGTRQRQYEALRAVFIDGLSQKEVARRFHYSHGAFRLLVHQFRQACAAGAPPPFFSRHAGDGCRPTPLPGRRLGRTSRRSPTRGP